MVQREQQYMLLQGLPTQWGQPTGYGVKPQQTETQQGTMLQVKRGMCIGTSQLSHLLVACSARKALQIDDRYPHNQVRSNNLHWSSLPGFKGRPQDIVPLHKRCEAPF